MPFGKRAVQLIVGIIPKHCIPAGALQREEAVRQEAQCGMVMEAGPRTSLKVVQPELLFELLIALLHLPTRLPDTNRVVERRRLWQIRQRVADRAIAAPFDQQPACFRSGVGYVIRGRSYAPAVRWPDACPGELCLQWAFAALPPTERRVFKRLCQPLDRYR